MVSPEINYRLSALTATATVSTALVKKLIEASVTSSELIYGEFHSSEELAGIVCVGCGAAFLIGNAVVGCIYEKLSRTHDSDYRENSERNENSRAVSAGNERLAYTAENALGKIIVLAAGARTAALKHLIAENYRLNRLYDSGGIVSSP